MPDERISTVKPCKDCGLIHSPFVACYEEEHQRHLNPALGGKPQEPTDALRDEMDALFSRARAADCHRCFGEISGASGVHIARHMILCPTCGNKRCPKASDHRLACTGSNRPGQPGSIYA